MVEYKKYIKYAVMGVIVLWASTFLLFFYNDATERGTFGDMFGAVNALFSGLAFAGIIITIILQSQELRLQREELKDTRKEFHQQNETMKLKRFDNTFFDLLSLLQQIVDNIDYDKKVRLDPENGTMIKTNGRDVFKERYVEFITKLRSNLRTERYSQDYNLVDILNETYLEYWDLVRSDFGHYFKLVYRIVKLVDETKFDEDSNENFEYQYRYISILRAQLSDYELLWLFFNGICVFGREKFKPLIEKYSILNNMPDDEIKNENLPNLLKQYNESAFKRINKI